MTRPIGLDLQSLIPWRFREPVRHQTLWTAIVRRCSPYRHKGDVRLFQIIKRHRVFVGAVNRVLMGMSRTQHRGYCYCLLLPKRFLVPLMAALNKIVKEVCRHI